MDSYKKLVEQAAEKYAEGQVMLASRKFGEVPSLCEVQYAAYEDFCNTMQSPEAKQLIEQVAREVWKHVEVELDIVDDENFQQVPRAVIGFNEKHWSKFMGEE